MKTVFALALLAAAGSAQAATFTSSAGNPDPGPAAFEAVVFDFNQATPELSGSFSLVSGSLPGVYAAPAGDGTQYAVVPMAGSGIGVADLDLSGVGAFNALSLYWGSIDTYNTLELYNGANLVYSLNGAMLPPANGDQGAGITNRRVFIRLGAGETVTSARFIADGVAFEVDDVAVGVVPEPQTWAMMIVGFGLVGVAARRRRATSTVTA